MNEIFNLLIKVNLEMYLSRILHHFKEPALYLIQSQIFRESRALHCQGFV